MASGFIGRGLGAAWEGVGVGGRGDVDHSYNQSRVGCHGAVES